MIRPADSLIIRMLAAVIERQSKELKGAGVALSHTAAPLLDEAKAFLAGHDDHELHRLADDGCPHDPPK